MLSDAFELVDQVNREIVLNNTWGHLSPEPQKKHNGWIIIAVGNYRQTIVVDDNFDGLPNSPWQYEDLHKFVFKATSGFEVGVYRFDGWYKKFKNGTYQFGGGKFKRITL